MIEDIYRKLWKYYHSFTEDLLNLKAYLKIIKI